MAEFTTVDGNRFFDKYMYGDTFVILNVKRYSGLMRGGIFVFGGYGLCGTIEFDDSGHGTDTYYHAIAGQQLACRTLSDDGINLSIELTNVPFWTWYTFIGCNCYFV